jgi:hypothetical protein
MVRSQMLSAKASTLAPCVIVAQQPHRAAAMKRGAGATDKKRADPEGPALKV